MSTRRIGITGASGFLGSSLLRHPAGQDGVEVGDLEMGIDALLRTGSKR